MLEGITELETKVDDRPDSAELDVTVNRYWEASKSYMGFGYNPNLSESGERLDMLNPFAWMKTTQENNSSEWIVYDAGRYQIVNRTSPKEIERLGENPQASEILEVFKEEMKKPKRSEIRKNCELRSKYLQNLIEFSGLDADYIDGKAWEEREYEEALNFSLDFFQKLKEDYPGLLEEVLPRNSNKANELYLPLEITEAVFLEDEYGVRGKFGPETERNFDRAIALSFNKLGIPYKTFRYPPSPKGPEYLKSREEVITTKSTDEEISFFLEENSELRNLAERWKRVLGDEEENLEEFLRRARDEIEVKSNE